MIHLCYIFIYKYRCLENVELVIDPQYEYSFDKEKMDLTINPTTNPLPDNFWGKCIHSLSGVFGSNGAGKTTAFRFLLNFLVSGNVNPNVNGIVVYEENDELFVYNKNEKDTSLNISVAGKKHKTTQKFPRISCFYYTGHFTPEMEFNDLTTSEFAGYYNASDGFLLRKDIENFTNSTNAYFTFPFSVHITSYSSQNNNRICNLLTNEKIRRNLEELNYRLPRYIIIAPNRGGQNSLKINPQKKEERKMIEEYLDPRPTKSFFLTREENLHRFIFFNLLNAYADGALNKNDYRIIIEWYQTKDQIQNNLDHFLNLINNDYNRSSSYHVLLNIYNIITLINNHCQYDENASIFYFDVIENKRKIEDILEAAHSNNIFLTSRFFDMYYSHNKTSQCTLSSGEQSMINLFSRIYDAITVKSQIRNFNLPTLFIFDEAEIGFHPEWQRKYISVILKFMQALYDTAYDKCQIIISSHSPLLQSDIPVSCSNYLKMDNNNTINVRENRSQTFASNVFELFRDSFFLEDGLIGSFAEDKLRELEKKIERCSPEEIPAIESSIDLIGDERLRLYFYGLLSNKDKSAAIRYYEEQISRLKNKP